MKRRIIHIGGWLLFAYGASWLILGWFMYHWGVVLGGCVLAVPVAVIGWLIAHDGKFRKVNRG
jgi:hypothetical protein